MSYLFFVSLAACLVSCLNAAEVGIQENAVDDIIEFLELLNQVSPAGSQQVELLGFSYNNCGEGDAVVNISSLSVTPDPLSFPGPVTVAADAQVKEELNQPLKVDLYLAKQVLGVYVKIPCLSNIGSCTYDDLCELIQQVQCPEALVKIGFDCKCPIKVNTYNLPSATVDIGISGVPAGGYKARANVSHGGKSAFCLEITLSVK